MDCVLHSKLKVTPVQACRVQRDKALRIYRQSTQGCQPYSPAAFTPRQDCCYAFMLEGESTPGQQWGRKD
jgi:hypothetical protein